MVAKAALTGAIEFYASRLMILSLLPYIVFRLVQMNNECINIHLHSTKNGGKNRIRNAFAELNINMKRRKTQ